MPRVFVLCPDYPEPSGGIRQLYRHVDVLNRHGFDAAILHVCPGFRCTWFANQTRVVYAPQTIPGPTDVVVVPEVYGPDLADLFPGVRKVVFNQNAYLTFVGYSCDPTDLRTPYRHPDVIAVLTVSEDNRDYLSYAFPGLRIVRIHNGIDADLFRPAPTKARRLAYMPRKNTEDVVQVINLLKHRRALTGFDLVPIDGRPEAEVAAILAGSPVFLSFGHPEGCPLPPLEAMAAGCVVVGYHGRGGREYFRPVFSRPVEVGDVVGMAQAAEGVIGTYATDPEAVLAMGRAARAFVTEHYSPDREERDIVEFWKSLEQK
jgi:glycosyltransferase involved in cell wall biosynthesis